jgi:DNA-binding transcriptional LysR family regulator
MDLLALRIFVEVMRRGSFAAVARDRNLAPSSISRAIATLEDDLGIRLFQRTTRQLAPTEAGRIYFERIEPIVDELERAQLMAADVSDQPRGTLRVTTPVTFGQIVIIPLLPELTATYPELSLELLMTDAMVDLLAERVDVALRLGRLADSGFTAHRLCDMAFAVCASPGYLERRGRPRTPGDLERHDCLVFLMGGYRTRWRFRSRKGAITEVPIHGRCVISNALALRECAVAGMGPVLLPRWVVARELRSGALIDLFPGHDVTATDFDSAAWLLYPSRAYLPLKVRVFVDFLKQRFQGRPPWETAE